MLLFESHVEQGGRLPKPGFTPANPIHGGRDASQARLLELDAGFCDVIVKRWQEFAGGTAVLDGDGRSFAEIAGAKAP
jgi:hypothetical protein